MSQSPSTRIVHDIYRPTNYRYEPRNQPRNAARQHPLYLNTAYIPRPDARIDRLSTPAPIDPVADFAMNRLMRSIQNGR